MSISTSIQPKEIDKKLTFVPQHESNRHQSVFAALFPAHCRIRLFQPVDEEKCQQNDVLAHLRRR